MDSYHVEVKAQISIALPDKDGKAAPVPTSTAGPKAGPAMERLRQFNDLFGNIDWKDADKIRQVITQEFPAKVDADKPYQNARRNSDKRNAHIEHDKVLKRVIVDLLNDHTELFKPQKCRLLVRDVQKPL